jgi:hypothetical protein
LISSTLVARVVTPVMYKLIPPAIEVKKTAASSNVADSTLPGQASPATP